MGKGLGILLLAFALAFALPFAAADDANATSSSSGGMGVNSSSGGSGSGVATTSSVIYTTVGGEFKFVEYSNPSTGYNWQVAVDDMKVVAYTGYKAVDCPTQANSADGSVTAVSVGGGCNYAYYFKATAEGKTMVTMKYMRVWDTSSLTNVKQITVIVSSSNATSTSGTSSPIAVNAVCKEGEAASKYCCADGIICKKVCRNGAYAEEKAESSDCKKAVVPTRVNVTSVPVATAVPMPTVPQSMVEIRMQKGWNLFSVPSTYASLQKTTCSRERIYYYNTAAGQYASSSLNSINGPRAHWFYSAEDCVVVFSEKAGYANDNYKDELKAGWNMVAAPVGEPTKAGGCEPVTLSDGTTTTMCSTYRVYAPVKISDYKGTCNITAAYSFDTPANNWAAASTLEAKKGYFVKVPADCRMYAPDESSSIPPLPQ